MILYYALGGGLGHLTRSLAILHAAPDIAAQARLLASSQWARVTLPVAPCPLDIVPTDIISSRQQYYHFLQGYLRQHQIQLLVLDTFPFGIVGEWRDLVRDLPRFLIARYLGWDAYLSRIANQPGQFPTHTLVIEPLVEPYLRLLTEHTHLTSLDAGICFETPVSRMADRDRTDQRKPCLVVHSGQAAERQILYELAVQHVGNADMVECIFPEQEIYPVEAIIAQYRCVVSGAGYNMTAIASRAPKERIHILHPFVRRFDNQHFRLQHVQAGIWQPASFRHGEQDAACWLRQRIEEFSLSLNVH